MRLKAPVHLGAPGPLNDAGSIANARGALSVAREVVGERTSRPGTGASAAVRHRWAGR